MIVEFTVLYTDGTADKAATSPLTAVETERRFSIGCTELFMEQGRMEALYWIMWRSLHPTVDSTDDDEFMGWVATVADFDVGETDDAGAS